MRGRKLTPEEKEASLAKEKARKQTPEYKAYQKARKQTPEYKAYMKAYMEARKQTPEYKAYQKAYQQTPEYKESKTKRYRRKAADQFFVMTAALGDLTKSTEKQ